MKNMSKWIVRIYQHVKMPSCPPAFLWELEDMHICVPVEARGQHPLCSSVALLFVCLFLYRQGLSLNLELSNYREAE